jgi:hypothetical protein
MLGIVVAAALAALPGPALDSAHLTVPRQGLVTGAAGGYTGHGRLWGSAFAR